MRRSHGAAMNGWRGRCHFPVPRARAATPGGAQQARGDPHLEGRDHPENQVTAVPLRGGAVAGENGIRSAYSARVLGATDALAGRAPVAHAVPITCHVGTAPAPLHGRRQSSEPACLAHELMRKIRGLGAPRGSVPAIALTAYASPADRTQALLAGYQVFLPKPFDPTQLVTLVARLAGVLPGD